MLASGWRQDGVRNALRKHPGGVKIALENFMIVQSRQKHVRIHQDSVKMASR